MSSSKRVLVECLSVHCCQCVIVQSKCCVYNTLFGQSLFTNLVLLLPLSNCNCFLYVTISNLLLICLSGHAMKVIVV
jgi:hypothetical protein